MISEICEAFGCLPDEAERQDPKLVRRILTYRNAKLAKEWLNDTKGGRDRLQAHPHLIALVSEMLKAQGVLDAPDPLFQLEAAEEAADEPLPTLGRSAVPV